MAYRKDEYSINGHEVTIQQVRGPDSMLGATDPSAWIDGGAVYALRAVEHIPFRTEHRDLYNQVEAVVAYCLDTETRFCPKCESFRDMDGFRSTGFAGRQCGQCATDAATCKDGGKHDYTCLNPHQRSNARIPTRYKCEKCGKKKQTVPTG